MDGKKGAQDQPWKWEVTHLLNNGGFEKQHFKYKRRREGRGERQVATGLFPPKKKEWGKRVRALNLSRH